MDNLFRLYSDLANTKSIQESVVTELRSVKYEWKINEEVIEEYEIPRSQITQQATAPAKLEFETDDFLDEVDKLLARAQESIKQDYLTLNQTKQIKNGQFKSFLFYIITNILLFF